jgi:hypothetical protein
MTGARQQRKSWPARRGLSGFILAAAFILYAGILSPPGMAASTEDRIVVNPATGLAISGFDPVAYFTQGQAVPGRPDLELTLAGTVWRFRNEGNRAAFAEHPDVYMPRFGGYDPIAVMRGASVPGHPLIFAVTAERLYLFYDDKARGEFLADPGRIIDSATRKWPAVARTIGR